MVVRHGESLANVAFREAEENGGRVDLGCRDADVALSERGREQSAAVGRWLREHPPEVVHCSPYLRTRQTWQIAREELTTTQRLVPVMIDDRIRDNEMGQLELHTFPMILERFPEEAHRFEKLGGLYYRAPGGESLLDVADRLRSFLRDVDRTKRSLVIAHDAIVLMLLYLTESLSEQEVFEAPAAPNGSVSRWGVAEGRPLRLITHNDVGHLPAT